MMVHGSGGHAGDRQDLEKRLRALRKKLRQVDSLQDKQAAGQPLTPEESEKLNHAQQWSVDHAPSRMTPQL